MIFIGCEASPCLRAAVHQGCETDGPSPGLTGGRLGWWLPWLKASVECVRATRGKALAAPAPEAGASSCNESFPHRFSGASFLESIGTWPYL